MVTHLAAMGEHRKRLQVLLSIDPDVDAAAWQQHGALLASIDRLVVEIESAAREPDDEWRVDLPASSPRSRSPPNPRCPSTAPAPDRSHRRDPGGWERRWTGGGRG